jgi:acetylglutamate kinase
METVSVIKIGGNIIDDANALLSFLQAFAKVKGKKILVHGGGKLATRLAEQMGIQQQMVDGRRITDAETLKIITMVYAGYINKNIVAQLQANGCNAIGLTGADSNLIKAHKRVHATIDYGFVGDIEEVNDGFLKILLEQDLSVIVSPVTHDMTGQLLNTNADTIAQEIARALSKIYSVQLIYSFEKKGVLSNVDDSESVIPVITQVYYEELKSKQLIFAGMIPKLDNAFRAISQGVSKVVIGNAEQLDNLINGSSGTTIIHD